MDGSWTETVVVERPGLDGAGGCGALEGSWYEKARELRLSHLARRQLEDVRMEVARLAGRAAAGEQELFSLASAYKEVHEKRLAWDRRNLATLLSIDRLRAIASADTHGVASSPMTATSSPAGVPATCGLHEDGGASGGGDRGGGMRAAVDAIAGRGQAGSVGAGMTQGRARRDSGRSKQLDVAKFERDDGLQRQQGLRKERQNGGEALASVHDVPSSHQLVHQQQVNASKLRVLAY